MKHSRRRDSLAPKKPGRLGDIEKAARKFVELHLFDDYDPYCSPNYLKPSPQGVSELLVRFAQRHGAKVRRETLKEFVEAVKRSEDDLQRLTAEHPIHQDQCTIVSVIGRLQRVLKEIVLTPRGPEKGRAK